MATVTVVELSPDTVMAELDSGVAATQGLVAEAEVE